MPSQVLTFHRVCQNLGAEAWGPRQSEHRTVRLAWVRAFGNRTHLKHLLLLETFKYLLCAHAMESKGQCPYLIVSSSIRS